jgi:catechol 2,3-dioxygenase-like lactoylglutathione lyase family enzyme
MTRQARQGDDKMPGRIRGLHQIVLTVSNPTRSAAFYEKILGLKAFAGDDQVRCIACGSFLLCLQRPPDRPLPDDWFDENRIGLDHIGFSVASRTELVELLAVLKALDVPTAGIEFDPDGEGEYVCFRDPDNIQVELYIGDYHE